MGDQIASILDQLAEDGFGVLAMTPEQAQKIVDYHNFERQRDLDHGHVAHLASMMANSEFVGMPLITFAKNGDGMLRLVDGHHRLRAALEYWKLIGDDAEPMPFGAQVIGNVEPAEAYAQLDSAQKVRNGDVIGTALGLPVPTNVLKPALSIAKQALIYSDFDRKTEILSMGRTLKTAPIPYRDMKRYVIDRKAEYGFLSEILNATGRSVQVGRFLSGAKMAPIVIETLAADKEGVMPYWMAVATGKGCLAGMFARETLVDHIIDTRGRPGWRPWMMAVCCIHRDAEDEGAIDKRLNRRKEGIEIGATMTW